LIFHIGDRLGAHQHVLRRVYGLGHADHRNTARDLPMRCDVAAEDHVAATVEKLSLGIERLALQLHARHFDSQALPDAAVFHDRDHRKL
jgi:hypothetical protein